MLVVDYERSEKGPQRRRAAGGRLLHCCCICGALATWGAGWSTYCSEADIDNSEPIPKFCSLGCQAKGGSVAQHVTAKMKQAARDAEWREPELAYRKANDREKYAAARDAQRRKDAE